MESRRSWTTEQRREADLEECGLVGDQFRLGAVLDVEHQLGGTRYRVIARWCSAIGGLIVLGSIAGRFTRYGESLWVLAGILGGTAVAIPGGILIDVHRSRADITERMAVYDGGVARLAASSPEASVVTWDDLDSVFVSLAREGSAALIPGPAARYSPTPASVGAGTAGALLITLPALSLPSMVMVGRALSWRITLAMAAVVAVTGLIAGLLLWLLT